MSKYLLFFVLCVGLFFATSASAQIDEFVATDEDFQGYLEWMQEDYTVYPTYLDVLGGAHSSSDSNFARMTFGNDVSHTIPYGNIQQDIFNQYCTGCHGSSGGLDLGEGVSYDNLIEVPANGNDEFLRVEPFNPVDSYLYMKVVGDPRAGNRMPIGGELTEDEINMVYDWINAGAAPEDEYPLGAIIVKETFSWSENQEKEYAEMGGLLGMAKRGGDFNPDHNGWEWFMLDPTNTTILDRGADLMDGMCNNCHSIAEMDYVFEHPAEYALAEGEEADLFEEAHSYMPVWDMNVGPDDFLGEAHGIEDDFERWVYKWQPAALAADGSYPIGTTILKRLIDPDTGEMPEVGGAITAMIKRGDAFNPDHNYWEWFMRTPEGEYMRGADLMNGMCNNCHAQAEGAGGADYVFPHDGYTDIGNPLVQELKIPINYNLSDNYPDPFNPRTVIEFNIPHTTKISLRIYDVNGRLVRTLINDQMEMGAYSVEWDGTDNFGRTVSSGVYFYQLDANEYMKTKRMILLK